MSQIQMCGLIVALVPTMLRSDIRLEVTSHFDFTNLVRISVINQNSPGRRLGVAIESDDRNHAIHVVTIQLIADGAQSIVGRGIALRENSGRRKQEERGKTFQHAGN